MLTPASTTNIDGYGDPPLPWERVLKALVSTKGDEHTMVVLGSIRPDGRPHAAFIGAMWIDDAMHVVSGPSTQKSINVAAHSACTLSAHLPSVDVVIDGEAQRVTDAAALERIAAEYREAGWPAEFHPEGLTAPYSAPSAGTPPYWVYKIVPHQLVAVATEEPSGATRWTFDS